MPANDVDAPGVVRGVADAVPDAVPVPAALMAETRNVWAVPLVRPVAVYDAVDDPLSATTVLQEDPPFVEDSTL